MTGIKHRLAKIEVAHHRKQIKPAMRFIWASPDDDAALEAATKQAEVEGRLIFVHTIYPPYAPGEDPGINTGLQIHG